MKQTPMEDGEPRPNNVRSPVVWFIAAGVGLMSLVLLLLQRPMKVGHAGSPQIGATQAAGHSGGAPEAPIAVRRFGSAVPRPEPKLAEEIVAGKVRQFGKSRRAIAERIAKRRNERLPPEIDAFFKAVERGDWEDLHSRWQDLARHAYQYEYSKGDRPDLNPYWQSVLDAYGVAEQAHDWPAQRLLDYGNAIMDSLRPGMVYVGGTDNGRWVPELMNESSGDPHIMLTQNALADSSYLEYLGEQYGGQFKTLSQEQSSQAFAEYTADAQKRYQHDLDFPNEPKQLLPGENITMVDGKFQVTGQAAVMAINERILQMLMAQNPGVSFALQESFPLRSTYPDAAPLGPLMELNASSDQGAFTEQAAAQSVDYWRSATQALLASPPTSDEAQNAFKAYSKDINSTGNLLAAHNFTAEAENAYKLATQVWPANLEAVRGLAQIWAQAGETDAARLLLTNFANQYPDQIKAVDQARATIVWTPGR